MASLHVRNIPDDLYEKLRAGAARDGRSLSKEVIAVLRRYIDRPLRPRSDAADRVQELKDRYGSWDADVVKLIRDDRDR
jgi:plasmid stability protein